MSNQTDRAEYVDASAWTEPLHDRVGERPETGPRVPHQQLSQNAPLDLQEALWQRMARLEHVRPGPSGISAPDTRALHLDRSYAYGPNSAFFPTGGTEFAHLHGVRDGSLHLLLPESVAQRAIKQGWAELHPIAAAGEFPPVLVMVYGPRNEEELEVAWKFVQLSYENALGGADGRAA